MRFHEITKTLSSILLTFIVSLQRNNAFQTIKRVSVGVIKAWIVYAISQNFKNG